MIRITVGCNLMREIFFFVCVRWTSGTEAAAAAVFGPWQTAGTADISFILKGKRKKHVPTNNHKGTTLTFHIGGTMQHILYRILVVLTTLHQLQSNMFTVFIMLLLEKPKLWHTWWCTVFDLWDMKPKTKNCQTFVCVCFRLRRTRRVCYQFRAPSATENCLQPSDPASDSG